MSTRKAICQTAVKIGAFGKVCSTAYPELSYQRQIDCWRIIDNSDGRSVGPAYRSEAELLADLVRYAVQFGC